MRPRERVGEDGLGHVGLVLVAPPDAATRVAGPTGGEERDARNLLEERVDHLVMLDDADKGVEGLALVAQVAPGELLEVLPVGAGDLVGAVAGVRGGSHDLKDAAHLLDALDLGLASALAAVALKVELLVGEDEAPAREAVLLVGPGAAPPLGGLDEGLHAAGGQAHGGDEALAGVAQLPEVGVGLGAEGGPPAGRVRLLLEAAGDAGPGDAGQATGLGVGVDGDDAEQAVAVDDAHLLELAVLELVVVLRDAKLVDPEVARGELAGDVGDVDEELRHALGGDALAHLHGAVGGVEAGRGRPDVAEGDVRGIGLGFDEAVPVLEVDEEQVARGQVVDRGGFFAAVRVVGVAVF